MYTPRYPRPCTSATYTTSLITTVTRSTPVVVLNQGIEYPANTERWLNDVGNVLAHVFHSCSSLDLDEIWSEFGLASSNAGNVDFNLSTLLKIQRGVTSCSFPISAILQKMVSCDKISLHRMDAAMTTKPISIVS